MERVEELINALQGPTSDDDDEIVAVAAVNSDDDSAAADVFPKQSNSGGVGLL